MRPNLVHTVRTILENGPGYFPSYSPASGRSKTVPCLLLTYKTERVTCADTHRETRPPPPGFFTPVPFFLSPTTSTTRLVKGQELAVEPDSGSSIGCTLMSGPIRRHIFARLFNFDRNLSRIHPGIEMPRRGKQRVSLHEGRARYIVESSLSPFHHVCVCVPGTWIAKE